MMRAPTPRGEIYRWHRRSILGLQPEIHEIEPEAGWYAMTLVKGGRLVPVKIWLEQVIDPETGELAEDERLRCTVLGFDKEPASVWLRCCKRPVSEHDFDAMMRRENEGLMPDPMKKVNLMQEAIGPNER